MIGRRRRKRVGATLRCAYLFHWAVTENKQPEHLGIFENTHTYLHVCVYSSTKEKTMKGEKKEKRGEEEKREKRSKGTKTKWKEGRKKGGREAKKERDKKGLSINDSDMNFPARILSALIIYLFPSLTHLRDLNGHYVQFLLRNICVEED